MLEKAFDPYHRSLERYKAHVDDNIIKNVSIDCLFQLILEIPSEFGFLGTIYKNMGFKGRHHLLESIYPFIHEDYFKGSQN
jgi:hypothetical protein